MPIWCFKSVEQRTHGESIPQWYWQIDTQHTLIAITSTRLFPTLEECIANARENGFRGEVDTSDETLSHPAVLTCEEGDYVHAIVQRSWRDRQHQMRV